MVIKEQLPKIGKDVDNYVVFEDDFPLKLSVRPDYNQFKSKRYHTEAKCVEVLVGLGGVDLIYKLLHKKFLEMSKKLDLEDDSVLDEDFFKRTGFKNASSIGKELKTIVLHENFKKLCSNKLWHHCSDFLYLFHEIKEIFEVGVAINRINMEEVSGVILYDGLSFLDWMSENSFPLPEELKIKKNDQGKLGYIDQLICESLMESFPGHPLGKDKLEDPLFVAVKAREALMSNGIKNSHNHGARDMLTDWIESNYPKIPKRKIGQIVSIVNDGYGRGKTKI